MKPYYDDGAGIVIYHGDCREVLPTLDVAAFDLLLTDPPYGIKYKGGGGTPGKSILSKRARQKCEIVGDNEPFDPSPWLVFWQVALFGAQHYYDSLPCGGTFHVWDKRGACEPFHTADFDTIWVNRKEPGRIVRCVWRGLFREVEKQNRIQHPTQKPLAVVQWVLKLFPGCNTVLDPYMGSGTTLRAAKDNGLAAVGIEIVEAYAEIAARRLEQGVFNYESE